MTLSGEGHQIGFASVTLLKLPEEVGNRSVGVGQGEGKPVGFPARRKGNADRISAKLDKRRPIRKHNTQIDTPHWILPGLNRSAFLLCSQIPIGQRLARPKPRDTAQFHDRLSQRAKGNVHTVSKGKPGNPITFQGDLSGGEPHPHSPYAHTRVSTPRRSSPNPSPRRGVTQFNSEAHPFILLQLGGGLYSIESETTEIRNRSARVSA